MKRALPFLFLLMTSLPLFGQSHCPHCGGLEVYASQQSYQAQQVVYQQPQVVYQPAYSQPVYQQQVYQSAPVSTGGANVVASWGSGAKYQAAYASALHRARNRIKGHCSIDMAHTSGVGWSRGHASNTPRTCFWERRHQGSYCAIRVGNEVYSTLIL